MVDSAFPWQPKKVFLSMRLLVIAVLYRRRSLDPFIMNKKYFLLHSDSECQLFLEMINMDDIVNKAAGVATLAGSAVMFSPLGMPFLFHGLSGVVVGGLGLYAAGKVAGSILDQNAASSFDSASAPVSADDSADLSEES